MLRLEFTEGRSLLQDGFARFFERQSPITRVRAAEPLGFDPVLHRELAEMGAFGIRVPEADGGIGGGLIDAAIVAKLAGRHLAPVPLAETIVVARLLAELSGADMAEWLSATTDGEKVVTLALHEVVDGVAQVVPAGAVAQAVLALKGDTVVLIELAEHARPSGNLGSDPVARLVLSGHGAADRAIVVASGEEARAAFLAGIEEWKLLTAAKLNGLARRALELAVDYARERVQFDRVIGSYQAVAHPLADRAIDVDASELLTWWTIYEMARGNKEAGGILCQAYWFACRTADETSRRALHTFGGYGVTLDYDIQLFFRRSKAWPLVLGDPAEQLGEAGRRLWWDGAAQPLPPAGDPDLEFGFGEEAEALAQEMREVLERATTPEWRANAHYSYAGFDPEVNRKIGEAGLLHPSWPVEWGGRGAHPFAASYALSIMAEYNVTRHGQSTAHYVGSTIMEYGSDELKREVLPALAGGRTNAAMGYSEPSSGSDVFGAKTRAVWDEANQEWVINGQKMFTSGSEVSDYIFLLTRTNPEARKHAGITMFLVPKSTPGVEVHAVHTMQEERTNATFYSDVRLPDRYRVGPINSGLQVLGAALQKEHGGGFSPGEHEVVDAAVAWARTPRPDGTVPIGEDDVLRRIARAKLSAYVSELLGKRAIYWAVQNPGVRTAHGPMNKIFRTESYQRDMGDLIDLAAPESLFHGREGLGKIEIAHRHSQVTTIYGGTSEVHRSTVAELALGLPRSR